MMWHNKWTFYTFQKDKRPPNANMHFLPHDNLLYTEHYCKQMWLLTELNSHRKYIKCVSTSYHCHNFLWTIPHALQPSNKCQHYTQQYLHFPKCSTPQLKVTYQAYIIIKSKRRAQQSRCAQSDVLHAFSRGSLWLCTIDRMLLCAACRTWGTPLVIGGRKGHKQGKICF